MRAQIGRLAKGTVIFGAGNAINRLISFFLLPFFTAYLTPADYGVIANPPRTHLGASGVFSMGMSEAIGQCYLEGKNQEHKATTIWTAFVLLNVSACVLVSIAFLWSSQISFLAFQSTDYYHLVTLTLITSAITILQVPFKLYLQFEERAKLFVLVTTISTLISIGLNVLMVIVLKRGVNGWVVSGVIAQSIVWIMFVIPTIISIKFRFKLPNANELMRLGIPLIPSFAFLFLIRHSGKYILQWFKGLEEVGIYSIGYSMGVAMTMAVGAFRLAWLPFFMSFKERQEEINNLFGRILTYYIFGFGHLRLWFNGW